MNAESIAVDRTMHTRCPDRGRSEIAAEPRSTRKLPRRIELPPKVLGMVRHEALDEITRACKSFLLELIDERAAEFVGESGELDEGSVEELLGDLDDFLLDYIDEPSLIRSAPELVDVLLWETPPFRPWLAMMEFGSRPSVGAVLAWVITDWASRAALHDLAEELTGDIALRVVRVLLTLTEPPLPRLS